MYAASKTGHMGKLARPFQGPYRVIATYANGVEVRQTDKSRAQAIRVALNRVRQCPREISELLEEDSEPGPEDREISELPEEDSEPGPEDSTLDITRDSLEATVPETVPLPIVSPSGDNWSESMPRAGDRRSMEKVPVWTTRLCPRKTSSRTT